MYLKHLLVDSFVKGIGKTSAALVVFGIVGSMWAIYDSFSYKKIKNEKSKENFEKQEDENEFDIELEKESNKFKIIFDNI
jgi:adenylyl- and sulfurtransferase ThiI